MCKIKVSNTDIKTFRKKMFPKWLIHMLQDSTLLLDKYFLEFMSGSKAKS